eukprot:2933606-Lingulodinium_polyedra.AAC.1
MGRHRCRSPRRARARSARMQAPCKTRARTVSPDCHLPAGPTPARRSWPPRPHRARRRPPRARRPARAARSPRAPKRPNNWPSSTNHTS